MRPIALLLGVCLLGPLGGRAEEAPKPAALIYGAGLEPRGFDPTLDLNEWNEVSSAVYSRLFWPDHEGRIVGDLAESYTVSSDGLTWRIRLRRNVQWHDGQPFTADDVIATWKRLFDPQTETSFDQNQAMVRAWEKAGTHEVIFRLHYPETGFLAPLTEVPVLPAHQLAGAHDLNQNPVGTGPYKFFGRNNAGEFVLDGHTAYHFGAPPIPRLVIRVIADDDARAEALLRGEVHLTQVKPQHVARLQANLKLRLYRMRTGAWRALPLNLRRPALKDARVRRAIDLAIHREQIVEKAIAGFGQPAYSPIPPASWAFDPVMNRRRHDPSAAARLLEAAGWKKNAEGWRERDGQMLTLELIVWKDEVFRRTAAELVREQLAPLGIRVNLHLVDNAEYARLSDNMGDRYDGFIGGWGGLLDPGDNLFKKYHSRGSQNYGAYNNREVDRLLERVRAVGPARRPLARRLYLRLVRLLTEEAVFLPIAYPDYLFAADVRVAGLGEFVCDSWYEFPKYANEWSWRKE